MSAVPYLLVAMVMSVVVARSSAVRADSDPDFDILLGQDPGRPLVLHLLGYWQLAWVPAGPGPKPVQPVEWGFSFNALPNFRFDGATSNSPADYGKLTGVHVFTRWDAHATRKSGEKGESRSILAQLAIIKYGQCGRARLDLSDDSSAHPSSVYVTLSKNQRVTPYPMCGERMVELVETLDDVRYQTCVDLAFRAAPEVSQITWIFHEGELEWALSPMPFRPDVPAESGPLDTAVWWPMPATCHPLFAPRARESLAGPRKNAAFQMTWDGPDTLVSLQIWQDDRETGSFFQFYEDGRLMTQGYRDDGQQQGLWWYFGPDGTLLETRLYALGVELEQLPVKTVRAPSP